MPAAEQQTLDDAVAAMRGKPGASLKRSIPVERGTIELEVSAFEKNYFATLSTSVEVWQPPKSDGTYRDAAPAQPHRPIVDGLIPIEFRNETDTDGSGKALGLNYEFQVGDPAFDNGVYIATDAPELYLRAVLAEETLRDSLRALVSDAHQSVRLNEAGAKLELEMARPWSETEKVQTAVDNLANVRRHLPLFTSAVKDARRTVDKVMPFVGLLVLSLTGLAGATKVWVVVDAAPLVYGALLGVLLLCVYAIVVWLLARGGTKAFRTFVFGAMPAIVGLPVGTMGLLVLINGAADSHPLESHEVQVTGKYTEGQSSDMSYWLKVKDWRPKHAGRVSVQVSEGFWNWVQVDQVVLVTTGRGSLGWTWIDRVGAADR